MAGPDIPLTGTSHKLVHCVDLFATILDLAGIDIDTATSSVDTIAVSYTHLTLPTMLWV